MTEEVRPPTILAMREALKTRLGDLEIYCCLLAAAALFELVDVGKGCAYGGAFPIPKVAPSYFYYC